MLKLSELKTKYYNFEGLVLLTFMSVFLPFYLTCVIIVGFGFYVLFNKTTRRLAFKEKYFSLFLLFSIYTLITSIINLNFVGTALSIFFFLVVLIAMFYKEALPKHLYEKGLTLIVLMGVITAVLTVIDCIIFSSRPGIYRATLYFANPNYLASLFSITVIIAAYKVVSKKGSKTLYLIAAALLGVGIYLTGSLFALVEVFIGVATLLILNRRHQMVSILLLLAATGCIVLYCAPGLLPRLQQANITTENRVKIWITSFEMLKTNPIFGRGYLTYFLLQPKFSGAYYTTHAHNILLDSLLCFGVVGCVLLIAFFVCYFKKVTICKNYQSKSLASSLILAVTAATLVHSTTDLTFVWIQTGFLLALISSGSGHEERLLKI